MFFDKKKIHNLLYNIGILYSDISDKDFYILPIFLKQNEIYLVCTNSTPKLIQNKLRKAIIELKLDGAIQIIFDSYFR